MSDMEGKVTRVGARWSRGDASDIDGQTERLQWAGAHESKRGQRTSFKKLEPARTPRRAIAQVQQIREWS